MEESVTSTIVANIDRAYWDIASMARPLNVLDILVIAGLIILAAILIYLLQPLVIAIAIIAVGYLIYRWYTGKRLVRLS